MQGPIRSVPPAELRRSTPATAKPSQAGSASIDPRELLGFALRSARRHWRLCLSVWVIVSIVGVAAVYAVPLTYESTGKYFITQNNAVTAALANGRRQDDASTVLRGLQEAVMEQDNLLTIVREANLVDRWPLTRTWPLALKDALVRALVGPMSIEDAERAVLEMLKVSLWVNAEDNSIRFTSRWRNAEDAYRIVDLARRNFFATRSSDQFAAIERAIAVLETQLKAADDAVEPAVKELQAVMEKAEQNKQAAAKTAGKQAGPTVAEAPRPRPAPAPSPSDLVSSERIAEIRRQAREISDPWQRRQADLRMQLTELRTIFGPAHPLVSQQEARIEAASQMPPELAKLKAEEAALETKLTSLGTPAAPSLAGGPRRSGEVGAPIIALDRPEDPEVAAARTRVEAVLGKARELSSRLDGVRLELATAEAGEKYRYSVVEAPEVSRKPLKPKRPVLLGAALALALLVGLSAGAVRELLGGQLLEPWQVRRLGLELLGEVELPPQQGGDGVRDRA